MEVLELLERCQRSSIFLTVRFNDFNYSQCQWVNDWHDELFKGTASRFRLLILIFTLINVNESWLLTLIDAPHLINMSF